MMLNQICLGAAIPFLAATLLYAARRGRTSFRGLLLTPAAMALGALWAVAPDLPRLAGRHELYLRLANDPRMDWFLWHYTIDRIETGNPLPLAACVAMGLALLTAAWRELRRAEEEAG